MAARTRRARQASAPTHRQQEQRAQEQREVLRLTRRWKLPPPWGPYRAAAWTCPQCQERIPVYTWYAHQPTQGDAPLPPAPPTLRQVQNERGEPYWANTCPGCGAILADEELYAEPEAVLRRVWTRTTLRRERAG